jgi:hypothetical protein
VVVVAALAIALDSKQAAQSGGIFRAHPDAPLAAPHRAELLKPTQGLIRGCNGGFASSAGLGLSLS